MKRGNDSNHPTCTSEEPGRWKAGMANSLLSSEFRWMAKYAPNLDFSLALQHAEQDDKATRHPRVQGGDA